MTISSATDAELERAEAEVWRLRAVEHDLTQARTEVTALRKQLYESREANVAQAVKLEESFKDYEAQAKELEETMSVLSEAREKRHKLQRSLEALEQRYAALGREAAMAQRALDSVGRWFAQQYQPQLVGSWPLIPAGTTGSGFMRDYTGIWMPTTSTSTAFPTQVIY